MKALPFLFILIIGTFYSEQIFCQDKLNPIGEIPFEGTLIDFNQNLILLCKESDRESNFFLLDVNQKEFGKLKIVSQVKVEKRLKIKSIVDFKNDGIRLFFIDFHPNGAIVILDYKKMTLGFHELSDKMINNNFNGVTRYLKPFEHRESRWFSTAFNSSDMFWTKDDEIKEFFISEGIISKFKVSKDRTIFIPYMDKNANGVGKTQEQIKIDDKYFVFDEISTDGRLISKSLTKVKSNSRANSIVSYNHLTAFYKHRDLSHPWDSQFIKSLDKISNPLNHLPITAILMDNKTEQKKAQESRKPLPDELNTINFYNKSNLVYSFKCNFDKKLAKNKVTRLSDDLKYVIVTSGDNWANRTTMVYKLPEFKFN